MINKDTLKETINDEFAKHVEEFTEVDTYRMTSGIPKEGLKMITVFDVFILNWIRQIIENDKVIVTPEIKVETIKEIFNVMDDYLEGEIQ